MTFVKIIVEKSRIYCLLFFHNFIIYKIRTLMKDFSRNPEQQTLTGQWMSTKKTGGYDELIKSDAASATEKQRVKQMSHRGVGAKVATLTNDKKVKPVKVELSELTQDVYEDFYRETSCKKNIFLSIKKELKEKEIQTTK